MIKQINKVLILSFFLFILGGIFFFNTASAYSPYDVSSKIRNNWNKTFGFKNNDMRSGTNIVYDIYKDKYIKGKGYRIINKNFNGESQPYLNFYGWAINFGYKKHTSSNNETYIVAQKVGESSNVKIYKTEKLNLSATEDVEYNNIGSGVWNECPEGATKKDNEKDCNFRYDGVGFSAYIPLKELFPDNTKKSSWKLFLVKDVDGHIVYTNLILPFEFEDLDYNTGTINLSSGVNANTLVMIGTNVIKRDYPRERGNSFDFFSYLNEYKRVDQDESQTAIWYGVRTDGTTKWASTAYWRFGGDHAQLTFTPEKVPPVHQSHSMTYTYKNGNDYWVQPNTTVTITLRQYDAGVGNKYQYLRLLGNYDFRARHDFTNSSKTNISSVGSYPMSNNHLSINGLNQTENTDKNKYGTVQWRVTPKTHGHKYEVLWHYTDKIGNARGYDTGSGKTNMFLRVDGQAPLQNSASISGARYVSGNNYWIKPNDTISVTYRQHDGDSGNKFQYLRLLEGDNIVVRSRHDFAQSSNHKVDQVTNSHVLISSANRTENTSYGKVQWNVQAKTHGKSYSIQRYFEDNVGNNTGYATSFYLKVDGVAPSVQFRNKEDTANFHERDWDDTPISVRLKFTDEGSGYKRSRYAWTNSPSTPTQWSDWTTSNNYLVPSKATFGEWYLHVQAEDNVGNIITTYKGSYKYNQPPVADFTFNSPIYEGNEIILSNKSTDPDGNPLTARWEVTDPNGKTSVYTSWDLTIIKVLGGNYKVKLIVTDIVGAKDEITKTVSVIPLIIVPKVEHTDYWKAIHEFYEHEPHQFYSGEKFMLFADVTDYPVESVEVEFLGYDINDDVRNLKTTLTYKTTRENVRIYTGSMYEDFMSNPSTRLKNGNAYFTFTARWTNGVTKQKIVTVEIIDNIYRAYDFHRSN